MTRNDIREFTAAATSGPTAMVPSQTLVQFAQSVIGTDSYSIGVAKSYPNVFWDLIVTSTDLMKLQLCGDL